MCCNDVSVESENRQHCTTLLHSCHSWSFRPAFKSSNDYSKPKTRPRIERLNARNVQYSLHTTRGWTSYFRSCIHMGLSLVLPLNTNCCCLFTFTGKIWIILRFWGDQKLKLGPWQIDESPNYIKLQWNPGESAHMWELSSGLEAQL